MGLVAMLEKGVYGWNFEPKWSKPVWLHWIWCTCWLEVHDGPSRERHWIWSDDELYGQILSCMMDAWTCGIPDHLLKNNMKRNMGPGDRTQVLMHVPNPCLPTELLCLFLYIIKTKYNIWKIMINKKNALKFKLPNQGVPRIHLLPPNRCFT